MSLIMIGVSQTRSTFPVNALDDIQRQSVDVGDGVWEVQDGSGLRRQTV
jgi:hypothetical protein